MSTLWFAVFVLAATPNQGVSPASSAVAGPAAALADEPLVPPRTGVKLRDAVHEALKRWAKPGDAEADAAAREFVALYDELQRDDQLARAQRDELRTRVRSRLMSLSQQIAYRMAKEKRLAKADGPKSVDGAKAKDVLAQVGGMGGFGQMGRGMGPGMMGGGFGMAPGAGGSPFTPQAEDNGKELVDLIQKTISPRTWDVNGGPGAIYYWQPGRAIVVSAPGEVHNQIGDVLQQLQRAGQ